MKILYWGTPEYSVPTLLALHAAGHEIVGVVTQPDRRRGRGKQLMPSAIKVCAQSLGLAVFTPERIKTDVGCQKELADLNADVSVVVAFGQILPKSVLEQPPLGCWNGHGSLLPRWRGAGPIQWALLEGDSETGVGIMAMEEGLDTGPVLLEQRLPISLDQNSHDLGEKLSQLTATLMVEAVDLILKAGVGTEPERLERLNVRYQGQAMSYARMLKKEDFQINWGDPALRTHRRVMGLYPSAMTGWRNKRLKVLETEPLIERLGDEISEEARALLGRWPTGEDHPGTVLGCINNVGIVVSTSGCPILIREAQLEGKGRCRAQGLVQQLAASVGDRFQSI
jgi:methionyl-tRNA formyltransferase